MISGAGTMLVPSFLKSMEQRVDLQSIESDKKLIVIQLSGGNDGLNTVIPFKNDFYYRSLKVSVRKYSLRLDFRIRSIS